MTDVKTMLIQRIVDLASKIEIHRNDYNVLVGQKGEAEHLLQQLLKHEAEAAKPVAPAIEPPSTEGGANE